MSISSVLAALLALTSAAYIAGRRRAVAGSATAPARSFHSLPGYYGGYVALWCLLPAVALLAVWLVVEPIVLRAAVIDSLPAEPQARLDDQLGVLSNDHRNLVHDEFLLRTPGPAPAGPAAR